MRFSSVKHLIQGLTWSNCSINGNFFSFQSHLLRTYHAYNDALLGIAVNTEDTVCIEMWSVKEENQGDGSPETSSLRSLSEKVAFELQLSLYWRVPVSSSLRCSWNAPFSDVLLRKKKCCWWNWLTLTVRCIHKLGKMCLLASLKYVDICAQ